MATFPTNVLCNYFVKIDFRDIKKIPLDNCSKVWYNIICNDVNAPVAQLDRVTGYEPVGRGFC